MDLETIKLIISPLSILLGVVVGFCLNFWRDNHKENRSREEEKKSIRKLIQLEIQQNLDVLEIFFKKAKTAESDDNKQPKIRNKVFQLAQSPLPIWSYTAWQSQMSKIPIAFNTNEIVGIQNLYKDLKKINNLLNLLPDRSLSISTSWSKSGRLLTGYKDDYENELHFWNDFEELVLSILKEGNPIKDEIED